MRRFLLLCVVLAAPLMANDFGVAAPDGNSAWILLEPPPGKTGEGLSEFAGDPGLPSPDVLGRKPAARPQLELWRYDDATRKHTLETRVSVKDTWLYAVFEMRGDPFVLLLQGGKTLVLKARGLAATDAVPADRILLTCDDFSDAPVVSPDESMLALRVFRGREVIVRVYSTADWKLLAESAPANFSRPVWVSNAALACIATEAPVSRLGLGDGTGNPAALNHDPAPAPGKLLRLDVDGSALKPTVLLQGDFPPETFTRALARDGCSGGVILARRDGAQVVVEQRAATPDAKPAPFGSFDAFRGLVVTAARAEAFGVIEGRMHRAVLARWGEIALPRLPFQREARKLILPVGDKSANGTSEANGYSTSGLGGVVSLRRGVHCMIEAVANPDYAAPGQPLCLHTVHPLRGTYSVCDSMRNPRNLTRISGLARRFAELDAAYPRGIPSTQLAFEMKISLSGEQTKKGTYVELFHGDGRAGKGRIRTEDNLGGNWLVNSIDGGGDAASDWVYTCSDIKAGAMTAQAAARAGKLYNDMVTQLDARRLLIIGNPAAAPASGGLRFMWRGYRRNLVTGRHERVWEYERLGTNGQRATLRFCAEMPLSPQGWKCPHSLAHADVAIAVGGDGKIGFSSATFSHEETVALPNLTDRNKPDLLLPKQFWLHEWNEKEQKHLERVHAIAHEGTIAYPAEIVPTGRITPGYYISPLSVPVIARERADKVFRELER